MFAFYHIHLKLLFLAMLEIYQNIHHLLKIFDYMKLGKLIISSNLPVLREILKDKHNSILIKRYNDEKEWLKVILSISKNLNKYDKMRKNAFNYANKFDSNWRVKELLNV